MIRNLGTYGRGRYKAAPIVFALIALVVGGRFFVRSRNAPEQKTPLSIAIAQSGSNQSHTDSDDDGLKDWEEQIYGTDAHHPDTDGDGANDGAEIAQGRDPLKKGPNDALTKKTIAAPNMAAEERPNLTQQLAEIFGQDYLAKFVQNPNAQFDVDRIADKLVSKMQNSSSLLPEFTIKDIIISRDTGKENANNYLVTFDNTLIAAFGSEENIANTMNLVARIAKNQDDDAAFAELAKRIDAYTAFLTKIKKISVPEDFVAIHLSYLTTAQKEREALKKIMEVTTDAAAAFVGIRQLLDTTKEFKDIADRYHALAQAKGIAISEK